MNAKRFTPILILVIIACFLVVAGSFWYYEMHREVSSLQPTSNSLSTIADASTTPNLEISHALPDIPALKDEMSWLASSTTWSFDPVLGSFDLTQKNKILCAPQGTDASNFHLYQFNHDLSGSLGDRTSKTQEIQRLYKIINSYLLTQGWKSGESVALDISDSYTCHERNGWFLLVQTDELGRSMNSGLSGANDLGIQIFQPL